MSTLSEIQDAVARLPSNEKKALQVWLNSQAEPELTAQDEQHLLRSLNEAMRDVDAGKGASEWRLRLPKASFPPALGAFRHQRGNESE